MHMGFWARCHGRGHRAPADGRGTYGHRIQPEQDQAQRLIQSGMRFADMPRAAAATDIVFSIVTDATAVRSVALGDDGVIAGLKPGCIYVDMSTIAPDASRAVSAEFARRRGLRCSTRRSPVAQ